MLYVKITDSTKFGVMMRINLLLFKTKRAFLVLFILLINSNFVLAESVKEISSNIISQKPNFNISKMHIDSIADYCSANDCVEVSQKYWEIFGCKKDDNDGSTNGDRCNEPHNEFDNIALAIIPPLLTSYQNNDWCGIRKNKNPNEDACKGFIKAMLDYITWPDPLDGNFSDFKNGFFIRNLFVGDKFYKKAREIVTNEFSIEEPSLISCVKTKEDIIVNCEEYAFKVTSKKCNIRINEGCNNQILHWKSANPSPVKLITSNENNIEDWKSCNDSSCYKQLFLYLPDELYGKDTVFPIDDTDVLNYPTNYDKRKNLMDGYKKILYER